MKTILTTSTLFLAALILQSCGYHFPGNAHLTLPHGARGATVVTHGDGALQRPVLAQQLTERLTRRLSIQKSDSDEVELRIHMSAPEHLVLTEDTTGLAQQYRITLTAKPSFHMSGETVPPHYTQVRGTATYYEVSAASVSQTLLRQKESEALEQLLEALTSVLSDTF